jgi:glycosyltransferase involved in cell wall biosynthesis
MISVLILTLDEEINLAACLDSVQWSDDVLVVDSFSRDHTVEIARARGARVAQNRFVDFAQQRNFGLDQPGWKHEWILHLDADERVTPALRDEMLAAVRAGERDAFRVASKMMFMGRWLKHSGMYPWYQVRLGRRAALRFVQVGHGQREALPPERIGTLREPMLHFSFSKGIADWVEKHNRYSTAEARHALTETGMGIEWGALWSGDGVQRRRALKALFRHLPCRPTLRFLYMYLFRLGFLDGRAGLTYCRLLRWYEWMIVLKTAELRRAQRGMADPHALSHV